MMCKLSTAGLNQVKFCAKSRLISDTPSWPGELVQTSSQSAEPVPLTYVRVSGPQLVFDIMSQITWCCRLLLTAIF